MTHEQLVADCFQWHWNNFKDERQMLYAVNNNVSAGLTKYAAKIEGNKNKAKGVVAGVLDFCYILPDKVCWLDAKIPPDKLSDEQKTFVQKIQDRGHYWATFKSLEEFKTIIRTLQDAYYR